MTNYRENKDVRRPFLATPDSRVYFPASTIEKARRATARCLRRGEGVALVVGTTGTGKTLLARVLAADFGAEDLVSVVSVSRRLDVKSFLQQFLFGLRQTFCGCDETELRLMTLDYLERTSQRRCVLLIDDAQNLSMRVFDEIRVLIDQCAAASKQLSVALFGANSLEDRLNIPALFPFQQRIVARSYLEPFTQRETFKYIDRELQRSGVAATFSKDAKESIARLSSCSPRVVNQLCDRALFLASDGALETPDEENETNAKLSKKTRAFKIEANDVERAWNNLQNIPEEEEDETRVAANSEPVVEFGFLDDEDDDEYNGTNEQASGTGSSDGVAEVAVANVVANTVANTVENVVEFGASLEDDEENVSESSPIELEVDVVADADEDVKSEDVRDENIRDDEPEPRVVRFDWEAARYGESPEATALEGATVEDNSNEEQTPEPDVASRIVGAGIVASEPIVAQNDLDERRLQAKRSFWERDDVEFFAPETRTEVEDENEENEEELGVGAEIDQELDARLREKFGAPLDAFDSENDEEFGETGAASNELHTYDVFKDGMRFEVRDQVEFVDFGETPRASQSSAEASLGSSFVRFESNPLEARAQVDDSIDELSAQDDEDAADDVEDSNAKAQSVTRRPIVDGDDGSQAYREINGFDAEDYAKISADDRALEPACGAAPQDRDVEVGARSLEDRAYRQIVASCSRAANDMPVSEQYLNELRLLEQEIAEEANLIRRIRNIHLQLRSVRAASASDAQESETTVHEPTEELARK